LVRSAMTLFLDKPVVRQIQYQDARIAFMSPPRIIPDSLWNVN